MTKRFALSTVSVAVALVAGVTSARAGPAEIAAKRADAAQVLAEIERIDMELDRAVDAYNGANVRLDEIESDLERNRSALARAESNYEHAQALLSNRVLTLYTSDEPNMVAVVLRASSMEELLDRVDTIDRVADQDARIADEVKKLRAEVRRREEELERARARQQAVVADLADRRATITQELAERERLYDSIRGEIARLQAAERERQRRLAEEAKERLAAERRAQENQDEPEPEAPSPPAATDEEDEEEGGGSEGTGPRGGGSGSGDNDGDSGGSSGSSGGGSSGGGSSGGGGGGSTASPPASSRGERAAAIALRYLGIPYRWGGSSPSTGFDCSGFVMYVYRQVGVSLPHHAASQYGYGTPVSRSALRPGDLVFFNGLGHNGIYIGNGNFVHSPHTGDVVKISSIWSSWYASTWVGARRL